MKNYWLDRKPCERRWKRIELFSDNCFLIMKDETPVSAWIFEDELKKTVKEKFGEHIEIIEFK
jgi:hypothetical protein